MGPAEIAPKRIFTYKYCYWLAKKNGIPFKMPPAHPFKSLSPLRLAIACDCEPHAIRIIFETIWKLGLDIESEEAVDYLESQLSIEKVSELVASQRVKDKLIENTKQAAARNIFGVPTYSVAQGISGYENFWGLDAQDMMLDFIASPADFNDEQMMLIEVLPEGIQRKR